MPVPTKTPVAPYKLFAQHVKGSQNVAVTEKLEKLRLNSFIR